MRDGDTLARLGGDEFVCTVEAHDAGTAAVALGEQAVALSCSIGVAVYPDHDDTGQRLLACADAAM